MRDILSEFGKDSGAGDQPRAKGGGEMTAKPLSYSPPKGPSGQMQEGPGLHGTNHGCCVNQGKH